MRNLLSNSSIVLASLLLAGCFSNADKKQTKTTPKSSRLDQVTIDTENLRLPQPDTSHSVENRSKVVGWDDRKPKSPEGFVVKAFAKDLEHPRRVYELPNGHVLVAESNDARRSKDRVKLLIDSDKDGVADERHVLIKNVKQPYGLAYNKDKLYVGGVGGVYVFDYKLGAKKVQGQPEKIVSLPVGGYNHHWTRNLLIDPKNNYLYISVGSASNVGEYGLDEEKRRANILRVTLSGEDEVIYGSGLRNPVGMDFSSTGELWTVVNERDGIGDRLVPDYLTQVDEGDYFGWPFIYYKNHKDPRRDLAESKIDKKPRMPDVALGSHTASLGLSFYAPKESHFPKDYDQGAFVAQHGSWNRSELAGYQVLFIPFESGKPSAEPQVFLDGFVSDADSSLVYGRPVSVETLKNGTLLVSDDDGGVVWSVQYKTR